MQIEPNGLMAGNPLTPLAPVDFTDAFDVNNVGGGHPFFRGNVMQNNGIDGLSRLSRIATITIDIANNSTSLSGRREAISASPRATSNQSVNAVWDLDRPDVRCSEGTVILAGAYDFGRLL